MSTEEATTKPAFVPLSDEEYHANIAEERRRRERKRDFCLSHAADLRYKWTAITSGVGVGVHFLLNSGG